LWAGGWDTAVLVNMGAAVILPLPVMGIFFVGTLLVSVAGIVGYSYRVYQQVRAS